MYFGARAKSGRFVMCLLVYWLLSCALGLNVVADELATYSSETVLNFIRIAAQHNLTHHCQRSLQRVEPFLFAHDTIPQQREFFVGSYASGDVQGYASKHRSRWHYRFMECIHAAGESLAVASEYPLAFCNARNNNSAKNASMIGICLPDPCTTDRIELLNSWIEYISGSTNIAVDEVECVRSRYEKQWFETLVPLIEFSSNKLLMWIVAFATVYHLQRGEQTNSLLMRLFLAFSVKKNFIAITTLPKDSQSTIGCIFGLRFLITVWVIVGHSSIFIQDFLSNPEIYRRQLTDNFFGQLVTNCMLSVDTFFVLSATLTSFHWFRSISRAGAQQKLTFLGYWLRFYRHRVLRLWPAYLYVLLVTVLRFSRSHFHPMWAPEDQGEMCRKNWWKNALFINSFSDNLCMPWTWYIGTDFIFFLLTPIFLVAFKRSFALGLSLSMFAISASGALHIVESIEYNFPPTQMLWLQPTLFNQDFMLHHRLVYIKPQYRIGPYIVGLILGYLLSSTEATDKYKYTLKFICLGWIISLTLAFSSLFGLYPALQDWNWPVYHLIYGATHRVVWASAIAWLIYACHNGFGGHLNKMLRLRVFVPLAAASYSTYLVHMVVMMVVFVKASFPIVYNSPSTLLTFCATQVIGAYFIGAITLFIVEMPAVHIVRILLHTPTTSKKANGSEVENTLIEN